MSNTNRWPKEYRYLALISVIVISLGIFWYFREVVNPLIVAAIFAYLLHPAVVFLSSKTRLTHSISVLVIYITSLLILATSLGLLTPVLVNQIRVIELDLVSLFSYYETFLSTPINFFGWNLYPSQF